MEASSDTGKKGSLLIAGSGIASIGHITLETLAHIKEADRIYHLVADPATEAFIVDKAQAPCINLRSLYGTYKPRYETYVQMSEVMLQDVRDGHNVLGIFYGHPGVFVNPTHRAIAIAREEGFSARMLAGVSAEDYLFSDLLIDPSTFGCAAHEATHLLYRGRRLDTTMHNIIWQAGSVGVTTMAFEKGNKIELLVDRLEANFGPDHPVVHYVGAVLPQSVTIAQQYKVSDLRNPDVAAKIDARSTLYIPPSHPLEPLASMVDMLGFDAEHIVAAESRYPVPAWATSRFGAVPAYGPRDVRAVRELQSNDFPTPDLVLCASEPMKKLMVDLALDPKLREKYHSNPSAVVDAVPGLKSSEQSALKIKREEAIVKVMSRSPADIALGHEPTEDELKNVTDLGMAIIPAVVAV